MGNNGGFRPLRKLDQFPALNPYPFDPRLKTFNAEQSIESQHIKSVDPRAVKNIGIKVYRSSDQTGVVDSTDTDVVFNTVAVNQGFVAPTAATFTTVSIPYPGLYEISGLCEWAVTGLSYDGALWIAINSSKKEGSSQAGNRIRVRNNVSAVRRLSEGDTVGLVAQHADSAAANRTLQGGEDNLALTIIFQGQF